MAATMELDNSFNWADDAFMALNNDKWQPFSQPQNSFPPSAFSLPAGLLSEASIERYGQITPPEELSPADYRNDSAREGSIPVEELRSEVPWPMEQQIQSLANYQPTQQESQPHDGSEQQGPAPKRRRTSKNASANQSLASSAPSQQTTDANPQPPKRKRGRPKSQPQTVEAYTADGFPFQVSSARQSHLEKNRVAAHKCRQRKKEYISGLEDRARIYSSKNKALKENVAMLREEVLELKNEVLRHAGCGFWAVDEYLARCAGDLLGMEPGSRAISRKQSELQSPTMSTASNAEQSHSPSDEREGSTDSLPSQGTTDTQFDGDFSNLELLRDLDDEKPLE